MLARCAAPRFAGFSFLSKTFEYRFFFFRMWVKSLKIDYVACTMDMCAGIVQIGSKSDFAYRCLRALAIALKIIQSQTNTISSVIAFI